jgi:hypothetical protein
VKTALTIIEPLVFFYVVFPALVYVVARYLVARESVKR